MSGYHARKGVNYSLGNAGQTALPTIGKYHFYESAFS
jgi:hypothetical protein